MKLVTVPEATLRDLIWNAELLSARMANDAVERQTAILRSYMSEAVFWPHGMPKSGTNGKVIDLFTKRTL